MKYQGDWRELCREGLRQEGQGSPVAGTAGICPTSGKDRGQQGSAPHRALLSGPAFWNQVDFPASCPDVLQLCPLGAAEPTGKAFPSAAPPPSPAGWACRLRRLPYLSATINTLGPYEGPHQLGYSRWMPRAGQADSVPPA